MNPLTTILALVAVSSVMTWFFLGWDSIPLVFAKISLTALVIGVFYWLGYNKGFEEGGSEWPKSPFKLFRKG